MTSLASLIRRHRHDHIDKEATGLMFFQDSLDFCLLCLYSTPFHEECNVTHKNIRSHTNKTQAQNQDQGKSRAEQRKHKYIKPRNPSRQLFPVCLWTTGKQSKREDALSHRILIIRKKEADNFLRRGLYCPGTKFSKEIYCLGLYREPWVIQRTKSSRIFTKYQAVCDSFLSL